MYISYSLSIHTSLSSSYLRAFRLPLSFDIQLGFVGTEDARDPSMRINDKGEFNSSSSSSLVYDFLSTEDPLLFRCAWPPISPIVLAMEAVEGGK